VPQEIPQSYQNNPTVAMAKEKFEFHLPPGENFTSFSLSVDTTLQCALNDCTFSAGFVDFVPTIGGNAFFLSIFGLLIIPQLYFGVKHRTFGFTCAMLVGLALEVVGYAGAIQMHFSYPIPPPAMIGLTLGKLRGEIPFISLQTVSA
jgi:hypothetical protein